VWAGGGTSFPLCVAVVANGKPVGEVKYLPAFAALLGKVSLTQGVLDVMVQPDACLHGFLGIFEHVRKLET